jgi:ABC-type Fe3+-hydroxamate transport system substrate-binding protein
MNPSIARTHRTPARRRLLAAGAAVGAAAVLALAGCSGDGNVTESTPSSSESESAPALGENTGTVPDVTNLLLGTAQSNLEVVQYKVAVVDASGAPVTVDDPTTWRVTAQDPAGGDDADAESTVTLTVVQVPAATPAG